MTLLASMWKMKSHSELREYLDTTQFFLRLVTCSITVVGLILIRLYINSNNSTGATVSEVFLFLFINLFGILMIIYPWYLSVSNNIIYFQRLKRYSVCLALLTSLLVIIRSLLSPVAPFHTDDPDKTSIAFRVMSTFYHISYILGFFLLLPFLIRKRQFLSSSGSPYSFALFVMPFVLLMLCGLLLQEWSGISAAVSYSPMILIVVYYINKIVNEVRGVGGLRFDEVFIIAAGFVPVWLGSMLGRSLMEMSSRVGSVGIVVVVSVWRILIFLFEVMTIEIGRKASRFNHESAFSFCVIYTGAIYAEFLFLSVKFNSFKFWALLSAEFFTIILWQGGIMIQFQNWIVEYLNSDWILFRKIKLVWLIVIGEMPPDVAEKASHFRTSTAPPDVKLSLIRSRAIVVQTTWSQNDIKMSSEFQSLICASTAVACDLVCSYFNIGAEFITLNLTGKRELLYIYLVNLIVLFIAQAIAKYELSRQVVILKQDVTEALNAVTFSYQQKMTTSVDLFRQDLQTAVEKVTDQRISKEAKEFKESRSIVKLASSAKRRMSNMPLEGAYRKDSTFTMSGNNPMWANSHSELHSPTDTVHTRPRSRPVFGNDTTDQRAMGDLQDILDVTARLTTQIVQPHSSARRGRGNRRASGFMQSSFFETSTNFVPSPARPHHDTLPVFSETEADWGESTCTDSSPSPSSLGSAGKETISAHAAEGYVMQRSGSHASSGGFQRCYCVLSSSKVLWFYKKKSDVSDHVSSTAGHYDLAKIADISKSDRNISITFASESDTDILNIQAYTTIEQNMWFNVLCRVLAKSDDIIDVEGATGNLNIEVDVVKFQQSLPCIYSRAMVGLESDENNNLAESSDGLPVHCGYLSKHVLLYREYSYYKLVQPGVVYCYKSLNAANKGTKDSSKFLFSLSDVLSVSQLEDDMSSFEVIVRNKTFKFEAFSKALACEWCDVLITWMKYLTGLYNASLRYTHVSASLQEKATDDIARISPSSVESFMVEMIKSKTSHSEQGNFDDVEKHEQGGYFFVKVKSSIFSSGVFRSGESWQKKWLFVDQYGELNIFDEQPSALAKDKSVAVESISLLHIISVDISPLDACCVHVYEKGKHLEIKALSLLTALSWRSYISNKILVEHSKLIAPPPASFPPTPSPSCQYPSEPIAREIVSSVLDTLIQSVELDVRGSDAVEIEPFSRNSCFFTPFDSGKNPLEAFLKDDEGEESVMAASRRSTSRQDNINFIDFILTPRTNRSFVDEEVRDRINSTASTSVLGENANVISNNDVRSRSRSDVENIRFLKLNSKVDEDDFANKLKTQSFQDLNKEFWTRHKWYLTAVVCFVTLKVLSVTSYMIRETDF